MFKKVAVISIVGIVSFFLMMALALADVEDGGEAPKVYQQCPKTKMTEDCLKCHTVPSFKIKEPATDEMYHDIPGHMRLIYKGDKIDYIYYLCEDIIPDGFVEMFAYLHRHPELPRRIVIDIHSPGGHAFHGWKIVNTILSHWDEYEIETHVEGMAFSAGFMIFNAGERRICAPTAELMWHEISYAEFFNVVTPSGVQDKKEMMDHMQGNANKWLASRSNFTQDEINSRITNNRIGWWMTGSEALEYGFCDEPMK